MHGAAGLGAEEIDPDRELPSRPSEAAFVRDRDPPDPILPELGIRRQGPVAHLSEAAGTEEKEFAEVGYGAEVQLVQKELLLQVPQEAPRGHARAEEDLVRKQEQPAAIRVNPETAPDAWPLLPQRKGADQRERGLPRRE